MPSLPSRISQADWAAEWPAGAEFGQGIPLSKQALPAAFSWQWDMANSVLAAISGEGPSVQLDVAHQFLDSLETWTRNNRALLTWPPSPTGFANALANAARIQDTSVVAVLAAYPEFCQKMMEQARQLDPSLPRLGGLFREAAAGYYREQRPANPAPVAPTEHEAPSQSPEPVVAAPEPSAPVAEIERPAPVRDRTVQNRGPSGSRQERAVRVPAPLGPPADFLVEWILSIKKEDQPALARQKLDSQIKSVLSAHDGNAWSWFDRVLFPEIIKLPAKDIELLAATWPSHSRFTPESPVDWVDQSRFWVMLRDTGPERREVLSQGALASLVNMERANANTRYEMATKMFPFAARKSDVFRQRLGLWMSFGGNLDEETVAASETSDVDLSSPSVPTQTVRQWVEAQNDNEWNTVLQSMSDEVVSGPRFRRGLRP